MLRARMIPCLLVRDKGLVKTVKFKEGKYVGDPLNAVRIFNEKSVDELMVLDIDATAQNREPDYQMIEHMAAECRMPLCYGGGIKTLEQAKKILGLGVEKVALSSAAISNPTLLTQIAEQVGTQSVVVVLDVKKKTFGGYEVYTHNGKQKAGVKLMDFINQLQTVGVGELVINSIDQDGVMKGYDLKLIEQVKANVHIPMTVLGGAGSLSDLADLIKKHHIIGVSAGSLFVFKGVYKAVLINYPKPEEKMALMA